MCGVETLIVYGYHGTSDENANRIISEGFILSQNNYDWLGDGIYFWQDAPRKAWDWARKNHSNHPAVICAKMELNTSSVIDLLDSSPDSDSLIIIRRSYNFLRQTARDTGLSRQEGGYHGLDRSVINFAVEKVYLKNRSINIQAVRSVFIEGEPLYTLSTFYDQSHVQIAVRDSRIIKRIWKL